MGEVKCDAQDLRFRSYCTCTHLGLGFAVDFTKTPCYCAFLIGVMQLLSLGRFEIPIENEHIIRTKIK